MKKETIKNNCIYNIMRRIYRLIPFLDILFLNDSLLVLLVDYLTDTGWIKSARTKKNIDRNSSSIPWCSYPFISFIKNRLNINMDIFEFGCGSSTLYYSNAVKSVVSVEHDKKWYLKVKKMLKHKNISNVNLNYSGLVCGGDYSKYAKSSNKKYDIIIIDGRDRVNCIINSISSLKDGGVLILDNAERIEYIEGINYLVEHGFRCINFDGLAPMIGGGIRTSIFYKDNNVLNI